MDMSIVAFIPLIGELLDRVLPDKAAATEAKIKVMELAQKGDLAYLDAELKVAVGQLEVNKAEAANPSVFGSGWRPFIGWVGGFALVYQFIGRPLLSWFSLVKGVEVPPELDMGDLITIVGGMLGLAGMRTAEKMKGVARK
jgi:hypothetical protein